MEFEIASPTPTPGNKCLPAFLLLHHFDPMTDLDAFSGIGVLGYGFAFDAHLDKCFQ